MGAHAARPLLDSHQWDAYFALFARDGSVPNRRVGIRLDTYSGAPVDFAAFSVDPADVLVAGAASRPRAVDTAHRTAVARWKFTPPPGYQLESNDVDVPLQNREGFYVVEARRGDAVQQVWLNVSRIGLLAKQAPSGLVLYGTDLTTGKPLAGMRIEFLVNTSLVETKTDANGIARFTGTGRPRFALATWGASHAFIGLAPQAPVPATVVGVRVDRGSVRAGERVRVVGFARRRSGPTYAPATGDVRVAALEQGRPVAQVAAHPDAAGAFEADLTIPSGTKAGDLAVLATAGGATGGATVHVDPAGEAVLTIVAACGSACAADASVPLAITAKRDGVPLASAPIRVRVVRSPHLIPPGESEDTVRFATAPVLDVATTTGADGTAKALIPQPTDGLASTYGVTVTSGGAALSARITAASGRLALAVEPESLHLDVGLPVVVNVRGFDAADGSPVPGTTVRVALSHGPQVQEQTVKLDANGRARASFATPNLGANFVTAEAAEDGKRALDAAEVDVAPQTLGAGTDDASTEVAIGVDRARYKPGDTATMHAELGGAIGTAFVTLEGPRLYDQRTVPVRDGKLTTAFTVPAGFGETTVGVAFVRNGALVYGTSHLVVDGPGQPRATALASDKATYAPGAVAHVKITDNATKSATLVVRLADGRNTRGAAFEDAPNVLASAGTTTRTNAADPPDWHAWVAPASSKAGDLFALDRPRSTAVIDLALAEAAPKPLYWKVERTDRETIDVPLPAERGRYVLSLLKVYADGDVGSASLVLVVQ